MVMTAQKELDYSVVLQTSFSKSLVLCHSSMVGKALQGAEQKAGREYLNNSVLNYGPLIKTGMLSATIWKQADEAFKQNSNLINASYRAFDTLADTIGNPKVIPTIT